MARLGTPENPEIIEPGGSAAPNAAPSGLLNRWTMAGQILRILFSVTVPAVGIDMLMAYFTHTAMNDGSLLAWLGIFLLLVPAFLLTLVAGAANLVLWPALIMILSGRATQMPTFRFINVRR